MKVLYSSWGRDVDRENDFIEFLNKIGFDGIEFSLDYPYCHTRNPPKEFLADIEREGLIYGLHLPWRDLSLASPIPEVREASVQVIKKCVEMLSGLNPLYFLAHLTTDQTDCGFRDKECINAGIESLRELMPLINELSIELVVETTHNRCCGGEEQIPYVLDAVENAFVCLDIPHLLSRRMIRWGEFYDPVTLIEELPPIVIERIRVIHIHGYRVDLNNRAVYTHFLPRPEEVEAILNKLSKVGVLRNVKAAVIESFRDTQGSESTLRRIVREVHKF